MASSPRLPARIAQRLRNSFGTDSDRRAWLVAWLLALVLHVAVLLGLVWMRVPAAAPRPIPQPEIIHVDLTAEPSEPPRAFTELPADRKDSPPKKADLLSNVTSRARDRAPGGDDDLPRAHGESDARLVKLEPEESPSRPPPAPPAARKSERATSPSEPAERIGTEKGDSSADTAADRRSSSPSRPAPDAAIRVTPGSLGNSDFRQPEMNSDGNAGLSGDVSLNTTAWDYAPWMERFGRKLMDHWVAPLVYSMGVLKDGGSCLIEVEISRSGQILRLDLLDRQGHPSLIQAAVSAVRSMVPLEPLPADFPEPTLILRLRMIYPKIRPR